MVNLAARICAADKETPWDKIAHLHVHLPTPN